MNKYKKTFYSILGRQKKWADIHGIKRSSDDDLYTETLEMNLFEPLSPESKKEFMASDGEEIKDSKEKTAKMRCLYSSSALVVNIFEYLRKNKLYETIADIFDIPKNIKNIHYEGLNEKLQCKFIIYKGAKRHPHLDVHFEYDDGYIVGIESKYTEPFRNTLTMKEKRINIKNDFNKNYGEEFKKIFPSLYKCINDQNFWDDFEFLDIKQILTHILGIVKNTSKFKFLYLYYPHLHSDDNKYEKEIEKFFNILSSEKIQSCFIKWTDVLNKLSKESRIEEKYYIYNAERYLLGV